MYTLVLIINDEPERVYNIQPYPPPGVLKKAHQILKWVMISARVKIRVLNTIVVEEHCYSFFLFSQNGNFLKKNIYSSNAQTN